jgi:hypothetical protein
MRHTQNPRPMQSNLSSAFLWNNLSKTSAVGKLSQTLSRLASVLVLVLAVAGTVAAQVAPPVGPYGFVLNATFSDPSTNGGAAILGLMNFDGAGNVSGPFNFELGSGGSGPKQSIAGSFSGTYSSNPDGTGTISIALGTDLNLTLAMVIDNRGRGLQLAVTGCTHPAESGRMCSNSGVVTSGVGEIEFNGPVHPIHQRFLNGSYGLQLTKSSPTPATSLDVWTFDGAGNVTLSGTFVGPDLSVVSETRFGTYSVNPDGTGTITVPPQPGSLMGQTYAFVITNGHSGLLVLQTNRAGDGVLYGTGRLQ